MPLYHDQNGRNDRNTSGKRSIQDALVFLSDDSVGSKTGTSGEVEGTKSSYHNEFKLTLAHKSFYQELGKDSLYRYTSGR